MLKSIQSNNSPGHSHNGQTPMVDLSTDSCPGIILKRNNKMNKLTYNCTWIEKDVKNDREILCVQMMDGRITKQLLNRNKNGRFTVTPIAKKS